MQVIVSYLKSESCNVIDVAFEEIVLSDILLKTQSVFAADSYVKIFRNGYEKGNGN